jgi:hypothetical protein
MYIDLALQERLPLATLDKCCGQRRRKLAQPSLK